jgi:hypothetical protein
MRAYSLIDPKKNKKGMLKIHIVAAKYAEQSL